MSACDDRLGDLGAHALGALGPQEAAVLERHVEVCAGCAAELGELAGLPALLASVPADLVGAAADPGPGFADRVVAAAARAERGRHRRRAAAAVAAAAVAALVGGLVAGAGGDGPARPSARFLAATDAATGVTARVTLRAVPAGTDIALQVAGVPSGARCTLVVVGRDGRRQVAGTWWAGYAGRAAVEERTSIPEAQLTALVVDLAGGRQLVVVPVAGGG